METVYKDIYIKCSSCVKCSNDSIKVTLCSRCYTFHRLIDCRNIVNNVLVQSQCSCMSFMPPKSWLKKAVSIVRGDVLAILRACPTSLSLLWRRVSDRAVAPVLLVNSALDMQSGK